MTRRKILSLLALAAVLVPLRLQAQAVEVPHFVNFQSVLRDDDGNLLTDGAVDLEFKVLDQDGDELYYEQQPGVQVVRSAVNVMIGEGIVPGSSPSAPTGGLPVAALDPASGAKFLQIKIGANLPSDPMEMGSVPYAVYAEKALGLVSNILETDVPDVFVTTTELNTAIQQEVTDRDVAITTAEANDLTTTTNFGGDVTGTYLSLTVGDDSHNHSATTISGLSPADFSSPNISQWTNNSGYITDGNTGWDNLYGFITDGNTGWDNSYGLITDAGVVPAINGAPAGSISGVKIDDINNVPGILDESKIDPDIARDSEIVAAPINTLPGQVTESQVPQYMRPAAFGTFTLACSGSTSGLQNAHNISSTGAAGRVNFTNPVPLPYTVIHTGWRGRVGGTYISDQTRVSSRDSNGFNFTHGYSTGCIGGDSETVDFVVFKN